jgi:hypothetical protein
MEQTHGHLFRRISMKQLYAMKRRWYVVALLGLALGLFAGCGRSGLRIGWTEMTGLDRKRCAYRYFSGRELQRFRADAGETVQIDYEVEVEKGALAIRVEDPDAGEVWQTRFVADDEGTVEFDAETTGRYTVVVLGDETRGRFEIEWDTGL